jgi:hypothetical protein
MVVGDENVGRGHERGGEYQRVRCAHPGRRSDARRLTGDVVAHVHEPDLREMAEKALSHRDRRPAETPRFAAIWQDGLDNLPE